MITVLAAENNGSFFSPSVRKRREKNINILYLKDKKSLKKLRKMDFERALIAPCAMEMCGEYAREYVFDNNTLLPFLPKILGSMRSLPVDELFVAAPPKRAAEIIDVCSSCANLFTVICKEDDDTDEFDRLYFNKGIILRRIAVPGSRVGKTALAVKDGGACPRGVGCVDLEKLGRIKFYGGELNVLSELCIEPTAELYSFGGISLPENGTISVNYGNGIFYLDRKEIL